MNATQLENWKRLSLGLARSAYPTLTARRSKKLLSEIEEFIDSLACYNELDSITDWDGNRGNVYVCDELSNFLWDNRYEFERKQESYSGRFGHMLSACIRAGFDVAVSPSAGVVGFTVGDLLGAFDGELPNWVSGFFEPPLPADAKPTDGVWL